MRGFLKFSSVAVLGRFNYTAVDFMRPDVYNTIRTYLTSGSADTYFYLLPLGSPSAKTNDFFLLVPANTPRCYNSSDPELNSTAWFAEYIGPFLHFLSLEDFQAFGSDQVNLGCWVW